MSEFENTNLPFLEKDCIEFFGKEQGKKIFCKTLEIYRELTRKADYRNNETIKYHMTVKLFPAMGYYKALQAFGIDDAIEKVRMEMRKAALINKQNNAKFVRMPFVFTMYWMGVKKHMAKNFPSEGWNTEWVRCDGNEIHFNLCSCLYYDCNVFLWTLFSGREKFCTLTCTLAFYGLKRRFYDHFYTKFCEFARSKGARLLMKSHWTFCILTTVISPSEFALFRSAMVA